jgi:hypothetical protein
MCELAQQLLRSADLRLRRIRFRAQPERDGMAVSVIADPVAFGAGLLGERSPDRIFEFLTEHEEGAAQAVAAQGLQHFAGNLRLRTVVESER